VADDIATHDANRVPTLIGVTTAVPQEIRELVVNNDGKLLVASTAASGSGGSTAVSVTSANNVALTTGNVITLTSGTLTLGAISNTSFAVALSSSQTPIGTLTLTTGFTVGQVAVSSAAAIMVVGTTANTLINGVIIQALAANTGTSVIGTTTVATGTGFQLQKGQAVSMAISNLGQIGMTGSSGDGICWIGS
jgi:hypothetical protein